MTNPTSNFGWQMPTSTDLVTDLPADFEVFGQAVDNSMADLKGGTSGQVLSKNSNTDMDFVWVTSDDANAIQNAIVDAKGDLITATAADTPARLAVGTNGQTLVADNTASTGLAWSSATTLYPWTAYTPTTSGITVGNGTLVARYQQIGKTVNLRITFTLGSTSAVTGAPRFTLPATVNSVLFIIAGIAGCSDFGVGSYMAIPQYDTTGQVYCSPVSTSGNYAVEGGMSATVPFTWTTSDCFSLFMTYEAA